MSLPCPADRWPSFSARLDELLALPAAQRQAWIASLPETDLHEALERVAASLALQDDFLAGPQVELGLQPHALVGPYELLERIGQGGMGEVWRARRADGAFERELALKLPHPHLLSGAVQQRFARERDLLARLEHPHIARFYDAGLANDGRPYLALECVRGDPITDACRRRRLGVEERLRLLLQVCDAVAHAHARWIAHRDLKPANVLLGEDGQVRLLDFGIAQLLEDSAADATRALATPRYAAPEQRAGRPTSSATDVHGLGLLMHELLTGCLPSPQGLPQRLSDHVPDSPDALLGLPLSSPALRRRLRGDLDAIADKALQPLPEQRYASAALFAADLRAHLAGAPLLAKPIGPLVQLGRLARRHAVASGLTLALLASLLLGLGGMAWQAQRAADAARRAQLAQGELLEVLVGADPRQPGSKPAAQRTVKELLDQRLEALLALPDRDAETLDAVLRRAGSLYAYLDEPEQAARLEQRRIALLARHRAADDPQLLDARLSLIWSLQALEQWPQAQAEIDQLAPLLDPPQPERRESAELMLARHDQLRHTGRPEAERLQALQQARRLYQQAAPDDAGHGATLLHLAEQALARAALSEAQTLLAEALARAPAARPYVASQHARLLDARARLRQAQQDAAGARRDAADAVGLLRDSIGLSSPGAWPVLARALRLHCGQPEASAWWAQAGPAVAERPGERAQALGEAAKHCALQTPPPAR